MLDDHPARPGEIVDPLRELLRCRRELGAVRASPDPDRVRAHHVADVAHGEDDGHDERFASARPELDACPDVDPRAPPQRTVTLLKKSSMIASKGRMLTSGVNPAMRSSA